MIRAGTHGELSELSFDSRSSSVYVNVNYSQEHTVNSSRRSRARVKNLQLIIFLIEVIAIMI